MKFSIILASLIISMRLSVKTKQQLEEEAQEMSNTYRQIEALAQFLDNKTAKIQPNEELRRYRIMCDMVFYQMALEIQHVCFRVLEASMCEILMEEMIFKYNSFNFLQKDEYVYFLHFMTIMLTTDAYEELKKELFKENLLRNIVAKHHLSLVHLKTAFFIYSENDRLI